MGADSYDRRTEIIACALGAAPGRRATCNRRHRAQKRNSIAWFELPCDPSRRGSCNGGDDIIPGHAAVRDFKPTYVGSGSPTAVPRNSAV